MSVVNSMAGNPEQFETRDSRLAAALMAVGIKPMGCEPVRVVTQMSRAGKDYQFFFHSVSECGKYETGSLMNAWREGDAWIEKNPEHPFAYAMATMKNHRGLIDYVKRAVPMVYLKRGKSVAMLPLNASSQLEEQVLGRMG